MHIHRSQEIRKRKDWMSSV